MNITQDEMLRRLNSPHNLSNRLNQAKPILVNRNPVHKPAPVDIGINIGINKGANIGTNNPVSPDPVDNPVTHTHVTHTGMGTPHNTHAQRAPQMLKDQAAILAAQGVKMRDIVQATGLTPAQIHSAKNRPNVQDTLDRVRNLALDKLLIAMGLMTQDKFENAKLEELAKTASSLARVAEKMLPKETNNNTVQFIMHAPQAKHLSQYDVIDV